MVIHFKHTCGQKLKAPAEMSGKKITCPRCSQNLIIPQIKAPEKAIDISNQNSSDPEPPSALEAREKQSAVLKTEKMAQKPPDNSLSIILIPIKIILFIMSWGGFWFGLHRCPHCRKFLGFRILPFVDLQSRGFTRHCMALRRSVRENPPQLPDRPTWEEILKMAQDHQKVQMILNEAQGNRKRVYDLWEQIQLKEQEKHWRLLIEMVDRTLGSLFKGMTRCEHCGQKGCPFCMYFYDVKEIYTPIWEKEQWMGIGGIQNISYLVGHEYQPQFSMRHQKCSN